MDTSTFDTIQCVCCTRGIEAKEALALISQANDVLKEAGVNSRFIKMGAALDIPTGMSLAETLCKAATGGHLVMGAGGKRLQEEADRNKKASAALGSVTTEAMDKCRAPVIVAKPKGIPVLDAKDFYEKRGSNADYGMTVLVAVDGSKIAQKAFDMALRMVRSGDMVKVVHVANTDKAGINPQREAMEIHGDSAISSQYKDLCGKAMAMLTNVDFDFEAVPLKEASIMKTIHDVAEAQMADLIVMGSVELAKKNGALGSVCAGVAKNTLANMLVAKNFA